MNSIPCRACVPHGYPALILTAESAAYVGSNPTRVTLSRYFLRSFTPYSFNSSERSVRRSQEADPPKLRPGKEMPYLLRRDSKEFLENRPADHKGRCGTFVTDIRTGPFSKKPSDQESRLHPTFVMLPLRFCHLFPVRPTAFPQLHEAVSSLAGARL